MGAEQQAIHAACELVWNRCLVEDQGQQTEALRTIVCAPFVLLLLAQQRELQASRAVEGRGLWSVCSLLFIRH